MNASMITVAFLAMLGIAAECVRLLLYKANGIRLVPSIAKETKDLIIVGDPSTNLCFVGSREPDGAKAVTVNTMERYTRFVEDNPDCFPLFDEHLGNEGIISIAGIASPNFVMTIPQWETVFGV